MRAYCTPDDVKQYLPKNLMIEGTTDVTDYMNPSTPDVLTSDMDYFIQQASSQIDSALSTQYYTPFKKLNLGGEIGYPNPIPRICAMLTAALIYEQKLQGTDRAESEALKARKTEAMDLIYAIQNGELILHGATMKGLRFVNQSLYNVPKNPAEGGRSKGNK